METLLSTQDPSRHRRCPLPRHTHSAASCLQPPGRATHPGLPERTLCAGPDTGARAAERPGRWKGGSTLQAGAAPTLRTEDTIRGKGQGFYPANESDSWHGVQRPSPIWRHVPCAAGQRLALAGFSGPRGWGPRKDGRGAPRLCWGEFQFPSPLRNISENCPPSPSCVGAGGGRGTGKSWGMRKGPQRGSPVPFPLSRSGHCPCPAWP